MGTDTPGHQAVQKHIPHKRYGDRHSQTRGSSKAPTTQKVWVKKHVDTKELRSTNQKKGMGTDIHRHKAV